ncbi:hypothetical protein MBLNU230_g5738t1 [Neophaeotheca triangularis]
MYGDPPVSSHVPHLLGPGVSNQHERLYVIFLQQLPEESRSDIIKRLEDVDQVWTAKYDTDPPRPRELHAVPWVRDRWPSPRDLVSIAEQAFGPRMKVDGQYMRSFIFVDSGWDADSVIAARWDRTPEQGTWAPGPRLEAVRVPTGISERLLTLLDHGRLGHFTDVFDDEQYAAAKVDLSIGAEKPDWSWPGRPVDLALPDAWPMNDIESAAELRIFSLRYLSEDQIEGLRTVISSGVSTTQANEGFEKLTIHNWPAERESPSREDLWRILSQLRSSPSEYSPTFIVDNILTRENDEPVVSVASFREAHPGHKPRHDDLQIKPLKDLNLLLPRARHPRPCDVAEEAQFIDVWNEENVINPDIPLDLESTESCPIFLLHPFSLSEQRQIRAKLSTPGFADNDDMGKDYTYLPYLWPFPNYYNSSTSSPAPPKTLQDLLALLEASDPLSPTFSPHSPLRISSYPPHFLALDTRILNPNNPKVLLASTLDMTRYNTSSTTRALHSADSLGWHHGVVTPQGANSAWLNLDIGNMGLEELVEVDEVGVSDGVGELWFSGLEAYREFWRACKEDEEYRGEMPP